jgi:hypothetical protein
MWQGLSFGANYKAAYCVAVCPAGEDVTAPFLTDEKLLLENVVHPLQNKLETIYAVPNSETLRNASPGISRKRQQNGSPVGSPGRDRFAAWCSGCHFYSSAANRTD